MISDGDLYRLAIFLGSASMVLIVLYHFLEVNASPVAHKVEGGKGAASKKQATN